MDITKLNLPTKLAYRYLGKEISVIVEENKNMEFDNLVCLVSEKIETLIQEDLLLLTEGYVSEIVNESFQDIDYRKLIKYYLL